MNILTDNDLNWTTDIKENEDMLRQNLEDAEAELTYVPQIKIYTDNIFRFAIYGCNFIKITKTNGDQFNTSDKLSILQSSLNDGNKFIMLLHLENIGYCSLTEYELNITIPNYFINCERSILNITTMYCDYGDDNNCIYNVELCKSYIYKNASYAMYNTFQCPSLAYKNCIYKVDTIKCVIHIYCHVSDLSMINTFDAINIYTDNKQTTLITTISIDEININEIHEYIHFEFNLEKFMEKQIIGPVYISIKRSTILTFQYMCVEYLSDIDDEDDEN